MKIKLFLVGLGLCVSTSVLAQSTEPANTKPVAKLDNKVTTEEEQLFLVDTEMLENTLFRLAYQLKQQAEPKTSHKMKLLRYKLLLNMLNNRVDRNIAQQKIYEAAAKARVCNREEGLRKEYELRERIDRLERMLEAVLDKNISDKNLKAQELAALRAAMNKPVEKELDMVEKSKVDSLERRLALLADANKRISEQLNSSSTPDSIFIIEEASPADTVYLTKEVVNTEAVVIPNDFNRIVFFALSSDKLSDQAIRLLEEVVAFNQKFPKVRLLISGFASVDGGKDYNLKLAKRREIAVCAYLQSKGVSADLIVVNEPSIDTDVIANQLGRKVTISLFEEGCSH